MTTNQPTFSPACTEPIITNIEQRICELHEVLLDESLAFQRENVMSVLHLYKTGHLPKPGTEMTWVLNGKVVDRLPDKIPQGSAVWVEGMGIQLMQADQSSVACQMAHSAYYSPFGANFMHEIFARIRLLPELGAIPNIVHNVSIANDTGSNLQNIFTTDLINLQYNPLTYHGRQGFIRILTAGGYVARERILIDIQLLKADGTIASPWIREIAVIAPITIGVPQYRLSGSMMRNYLYFATAPGNTTLFVAEKKHGIVTQLPVV